MDHSYRFRVDLRQNRAYGNVQDGKVSSVKRYTVSFAFGCRENVGNVLVNAFNRISIVSIFFSIIPI